MKYETSHPWINFKLSLPNDFRLWLMLGEIASKVQHLNGVPLRPEVAQDLHRIYLAKGVLATTAIEGNTLDEDQVRQLIDGKLELPKSQKYLQQEVQNIVDLCNQETKTLLGPGRENRKFCRSLIEEYNRGILKGLTLSEDTVAGEFRKHSVIVGNVYKGAPPEDCEYLVDRLCEWLNGSFIGIEDEDLKIPLALIKAIVAHVYIAWIHPFGDGNGRTARLLEFHLLFAAGFPLPASHLLSDHYNRTRAEYYRELANASRSGGDLIPFIKYALRGFLDGIRAQIHRIRTHQMQITWENYVHYMFSEQKPSKTQKRRRELVFDLTNINSWVEVNQIHLLTPKLAREYATAGGRMVQRDLNAIAKMRLIVRTHGKVMANKRMILAFLPPRVVESRPKPKADNVATSSS